MKATKRGVAGILTMALAFSPAMAQKKNSERNAYFGEQHVHTSWSFDAYIFGNHITGPADAYKYAKGEPILHPLGFPVKINRAGGARPHFSSPSWVRRWPIPSGRCSLRAPSESKAS
jgi:hypothetical protein